MAFRLVLGTTLVLVSSLVLVTATFDQDKSVIPLVEQSEAGAFRAGRDLLLTTDDGDFDFFRRKASPSSGDLKLDSYQTLLQKSKLRFRQTNENNQHHGEGGHHGGEGGGHHGEHSRLKAALAKLQLRSDQFLDLAQKTSHSAVLLMAEFTRLVENRHDNFIIYSE